MERQSRDSTPPLGGRRSGKAELDRERRESSRWQYDASDKVVKSCQGWQYGASDLDLAATQAGGVWKLELATTQAGGVWVSGVWISGAPTIAAYSRRRLTGLVWSGGIAAGC